MNMINENDLQKYVDEANNKSQDAGTKNLEKRMKREVFLRYPFSYPW